MTDEDRTFTALSTATLERLADSKARTILQATSSEPQTVPKPVDEFNVSTGTTDQRVATLIETALFEQPIRGQTDGQETDEHITCVTAVQISIEGDEKVTAVVLREPADRTGAHRVTDEQAARQPEIVTDGGMAKTNGEDRQERLQALFTDVTGTEELVVSQEDTNSSKVLEEATDLSGYVAASMSDDGLTDAIDKYDQDGSV